MKKISILIIVCSLSCFGALHAQSSNDTTTAKMFLMLQQTGQFEKAYQLLDTFMTKTVSAAQLQKAWQEQFVGRHGNFIDAQFTSQHEDHGFNAVYEKCAFEKDVVNIRFIFSKRRKIVGFVMAGITPAARSHAGK